MYDHTLEETSGTSLFVMWNVCVLISTQQRAKYYEIAPGWHWVRFIYTVIILFYLLNRNEILSQRSGENSYKFLHLKVWSFWTWTLERSCCCKLLLVLADACRVLLQSSSRNHCSLFNSTSTGWWWVMLCI
jgi:hypothetical protein